MASEEQRVIGGTRRPDGTVRKERKVRSGYVPQDEQEVYVSRGAKFRDTSKTHIPGVDPVQAALMRAAALNANKTKSQRKNEKRKEKKAAEKPVAPAGSMQQATSNTAARLENLSLGGGESAEAASRGGGGSAAAAPAAQQATPVTDTATVERQIRALKKKLRQCDVLRQEAEEGAELTAEEQKKLDRYHDFTTEVKTLETQLQSA